MNLSNYRTFAVKTALKAGDILMRNYGKIQALEWKLKTNFKIQVDDESDALIREEISRKFPAHSIYSEENRDKLGKSDLSWVVDPLDGTIPYTYGFCDHFSVCISLARGKKPIVGVIYAPLRNELYVAEEGNGVHCNNRKIRVSRNNNLNRSIIGFGAGKELPEFKRVDQIKYEKNLLDVNGVTTTINTGCASVPLAFVASGKIHGCFYPNLEPWDMAAGVVINREAGAKVTNLEGKKWTLDDSSILTANPVLHKNLINLLHQ